MKSLDNKLEDIISNSGIYFYTSEIENELNMKDKLLDLNTAMSSIWNNLPDDANIAIYGLGYAFEELFSEIDLSSKNIVCMIDKRSDLKTFRGYPVIRVENLSQYNIDIVLAVSQVYYQEMEVGIKKYSSVCHIIDVVKEAYSLSYYRKYNGNISSVAAEDTYMSYLSLNEALRLYSKTNDFKYNLYIINAYLVFRDLKNALIFIDKYIHSDFPDTDKMVALQQRLYDLLDEVKQNLASNKNSQCLVLVPDSVGVQQFTPENMPFLYGFSKENIYCPNAYVHMGFTSTSILSIFGQKYFFDNRLYKNPVLSGNEPFFQYVSENSIDFTYYCAYLKAVFGGAGHYYELHQKGCADLIWQYLCNAFEKDAKTISFLHFSDTHSPWLTLNYTDPSDVSVDILYFQSIQYVDSQMEFLFSLLPSATKILVTSDHGRLMPEHLASRCNIPYIIRDGITHGATDERLVSHLDTATIALNLVNDKPAFDGIPPRSLVEVNGEFYYTRDMLIPRTPEQGRAFKCFITHEDKYVVFYNGEEMYFLLSDDSNNLIDDPKCAERVNWFRANVNTEFPDWSDDNGRYDITREYMDIDKGLSK